MEVVVRDSTSSGTGTACPFQSPGMAQNQMLISPNRMYEARMRSDGNFVIYGSSSQDLTLGVFRVCRAGSACIATWSTEVRGGTAPYTLKMQDDSNLVLYGKHQPHGLD
jgi:hypothetical protein